MMRTKKSRRPQARVTPIHALFAAAILALVAMPLAFAGAASGPGATASAVSNAKFKKLKKRVAALEGRSTAPTGLAGGDLSGTYPNPTIGANKVTGDKIPDETLTGFEIAPDSLFANDLATNSVGASELRDVEENATGFVSVAAGGTERVDVFCDAGEQSIGFGGTWDSDDADLSISEAFRLTGGNTGWTVEGTNADGVAHGFSARVVCLVAS